MDIFFCVDKKTLYLDFMLLARLVILSHRQALSVLYRNMVCLIHRALFHVGMATTVLVGGKESSSFFVRNDLCQGCKIAPTPFILHF